jgi:DNA-binding HxlR family transcriptional regulator
MESSRQIRQLDPAAICRSSDPLAVRELLTKIGDKWTIFVVLSLDLLGGRARFSELERAVPGISQRMLSATLKTLERDGMVIREVFPEVPPRVEYEMTELGRRLLRPTQGLVDWAKENWEQVREAQSRYDERQRRPLL